MPQVSIAAREWEKLHTHTENLHVGEHTQVIIQSGSQCTCTQECDDSHAWN